MKNSFVLEFWVSAEGKNPKWLWVGKVLLLSRISSKGVSDGEKYPLLQYMECSNPLDDIDERLGCMCLRWSTGDEMDHMREKRE